MARFRQGCALVLSLTLWVVDRGAADQPPPPASAFYDRPVLVMDPGTHTTTVQSASADAAGRWLVTGSHDKTVRVWSLADGTLARTIRLPAGPGGIGKVYAVAISPDGSLISVGGWTRATAADPQEQIEQFDRATGSLVRRIEGLPGNVFGLAYSPDGTRLAAMLGGGGLRVYAKETGWLEIARDEAYSSPGYGVDVAPDGSLATTSFDGKI